ncbi:MAG: hypothetical protein HYW34_02255 [Candidatus Brennerbacteria bacterium]|nr:hypothetical protein [Candidatus Brennerbacteria bacterium]
MSYFLIANNLHLGAELFGAIVFFLTAWLFLEAFWIKKDLFSLSRVLGFSLLSLWQLLHALNEGGDNIFIANNLIYIGGLLFILISYGLEKMASKPLYNFAVSIPLFLKIAANAAQISAGILTLITFLLTKRYFKNIDKPLKWLLIGFAALTASSMAAIFTKPEISNTYWVIEHIIKIIAFSAFSVWIWKFLSLRIKEEALIVFVAMSLFISLLITTTFSIFFLKRIELETEKTLSANAQILNFYLASLKNKALASSQIIANNEDFGLAVKTKDMQTLKEISDSLIKTTGQDFITVALKRGEIIFKANFPINNEENALSEKIGAEALEGRVAATIDETIVEGLSIRAAAPIYSRGTIIGAVITGTLLNKTFVQQFKDISNLETTIFKNKKVKTSSFLLSGQTIEYPKEKYIGLVDFIGQTVIGSFQPLKNIDGESAAVFSITTTPGELLRNAQTTNRFTMIIIFSIVLILIMPLYRFSVFLSDKEF